MTENADIRPENPLEQGFLLGELRIDPQDGTVSGPGGREKLDPKVMDVLVMLARHAGHVVLREDLLAQLWPNAVVTDDVLSRCIYELRRQLSQAAGDERLKAAIETVPKRGYRLNGEVAPLQPLPETQPPMVQRAGRPRRLALVFIVAIPLIALAWLGIRLMSAPDPQARSIAVLPFTDMSAGQDQGYLADGIADEIISRLGRAGDLRVIARGSSFSFRGKPVPLREIAADLNVSYVLEGSVRKDGDRIRITAQLIKAADNSHAWSETFDRNLDDLFSVQDEIAGAVANALRVTLADTATRAINHAAYELFLQGEHIYNRRGPGDIARSAKYYEDALAIEPNFARAWAALAGAYSLMAYEGDIAPEVGLEKQGAAARKAIELDPDLAVGHARLAQYYFDIGDRKTSYAIFDKALALDQNDPSVAAFAAGIAMRVGNVQEAIERYQGMVARDPRYAAYHANLGVYLVAANRLGEAETAFRKALDLNPNFGSGVELALARVLILQKRFDDADAAIEEMPDDEFRDQGVALLEFARGRETQADAALERLAAQSTSSPDIRLAEVYAFRGMKEEAFESLEGLRQALDRDEPSLASQIWSWQVELRVSPFLKSLHGDPRWEALLAEPA